MDSQFPKRNLTDLDIIVINNSNFELEILSPNLFSTLNISVYNESAKGLSHARNAGSRNAKNEWLIFIDDDAKLHRDYFERLDYIIKNYNFDCFGGMYYAWHPYGKPKWLPDSFGTKEIVRNDIGLIDGKNGWNSGGNFAIKKKVLEEIGGFDTNLGMKGNKIGYGEETDLQERLIQARYKVGFDPELKIDHAVLPHKLKVSWHLKHQIAMGRYHDKNQKKITVLTLFRVFSGMLIKHIPKNIAKVFTNKQYFIQNAIIDSLSPLLWYYGVFTGKSKK